MLVQGVSYDITSNLRQVHSFPGCYHKLLHAAGAQYIVEVDPRLPAIKYDYAREILKIMHGFLSDESSIRLKDVAFYVGPPESNPKPILAHRFILAASS